VQSHSRIATSRDLPAGVLRQIADSLLNLVYPDCCIVCSSEVSRLRDCGVCESCWHNVQLLRISRPWCASCGLPFQSFEADDIGRLCGRCSVETPPYSGARSFGYYRGELSRLIQEFKFHDRRNLARLLGPLLAQTFLDTWQRTQADLIIPLPLHSSRKRERGFNQAALLAKWLSRHLILPYSERALSRVRRTAPQIGLSDAARFANVRSAFRCPNRDLIRGVSVLLVDDVMTTGATLTSASLALVEAGVRRVSVLTVARAVPGVE